LFQLAGIRDSCGEVMAFTWSWVERGIEENLDGVKKIWGVVRRIRKS